MGLVMASRVAQRDVAGVYSFALQSAALGVHLTPTGYMSLVRCAVLRRRFEDVQAWTWLWQQSDAARAEISRGSLTAPMLSESALPSVTPDSHASAADVDSMMAPLYASAHVAISGSEEHVRDHEWLHGRSDLPAQPWLTDASAATLIRAVAHLTGRLDTVQYVLIQCAQITMQACSHGQDGEVLPHGSRFPILGPAAMNALLVSCMTSFDRDVVVNLFKSMARAGLVSDKDGRRILSLLSPWLEHPVENRLPDDCLATIRSIVYELRMHEPANQLAWSQQLLRDLDV